MSIFLFPTRWFEDGAELYNSMGIVSFEYDGEREIMKNLLYAALREDLKFSLSLFRIPCRQGCISCGPCSCPELTEDHVLTSAYVEILRTVTRNAVNKSV